MYISGDITDFPSRLHQHPEDMSDLASFVTEGQSYSALSDVFQREQWNLEYSRKVDAFTGTGIYTEGSPF